MVLEAKFQDFDCECVNSVDLFPRSLCPPTMTADTYSLELEKSVLAISIVMVKGDWGSREEKTASHAGADETDDLQSMVVPPTFVV